MKDLPTQDWIHQFENYTQTDNSTINDSNASKIDTEICLMVGLSIQCLI
jgi:hypothetical protein